MLPAVGVSRGRPHARSLSQRGRLLLGLVAGAALLALGSPLLLTSMGSFLIVEDPLEPAVAIVVMGGHRPFREMEAAEIYHAGWAPRILLVREGQREEGQALQSLGVAVPEGWEVSRDVLVRLGVPRSAILIADGEADATLEELQVVMRTLAPGNAPVILVTSKYHARRVSLTWRHVTGGRPHGIVRIARKDPFDPDRWWQERRFILSVVREYLGLIHYGLGFPVPTRAAS